MADIKQKESKKGTIKTLNKAQIATEKTKNSILKTKEFIQDGNAENSEEYASNKMEFIIDKSINKGVRDFNEHGKKSLDNINKDFKNIKQKINNNKLKQSEKKIIKNTKNNIQKTKKTIKATGKSIKTGIKSSKKAIKTTENAIKTTQRTAKTTVKASQKAIQAAKVSAKATVAGVKAATKATISAIKAIIASVKGLVAALMAGGWVAVVVIVIICMVGMIASSIYGIFFSKELKGNEMTIGYTTLQLENELNMKITGLKILNAPYFEYQLVSNKAQWKDILAVYAVRINGGNNSQEVMTLDKEKQKILKDTFWDMNEINVKKQLDKEKLVKLTITIRGKSVQEIANEYKFSDAQKKMLDEVLNGKYDEAWKNTLNNINTDIVKVAESQLGNKGGEPYWSWYGYQSRVEWCACFVSWCANQCGYIEGGIIPKFSNCENGGIPWFKEHLLWQERGFTPKSGDIIFFDWYNSETQTRDGKADHVGIVEKVENGKVHTIEGNSGDECCRREYDLNSADIVGYGTPMYSLQN